MDLTFITNQSNTQTPILGIIDHQSRLSLSLTQLQTKSTINILRVLFDAIEKFGKPENTRTEKSTTKHNLMTFWKGTLVGDYYSPT